jgi:hypothetical protein
MPLTRFMRYARRAGYPFVPKPNVLSQPAQRRRAGGGDSVTLAFVFFGIAWESVSIA